jgi:pilus assembly protein CpaB
LSEHDVLLSAERGFGAAFDADLADDIPLVGFAEEGGEFGDIAFIGFADEAAPTDLGSPAGSEGRIHAASLRQRLGAALRTAAAAARLAALQLFKWLRYQLIGTHLRARRSRAVAILAGAVLLSIGCGVVLRHWLPARPDRPVANLAPPAPPAPPAVKPVLVARQAIGRGRVLTAADLQWQAWPTSDIKQPFVVRGTRRMSAFYGFVARRPIAAGEPIGGDSIVNPGDRGALAAALPPGMRAVSVDIREETAASGLVMPGDEVDLLLSLPVPALDRSDGTSHYAVQTILGNVRVLAIDQDIAGRDGQAIIGRTATLEVTPKEAEIVTLAGTMAQNAGNLRLALRSLVRIAAASPAPAAPRAPRNFLLESDISRLMPQRRKDAASPSAGPLTIVRRGERSTAQPSMPGS